MFEINEKEKTVTYSEQWSIEDAKIIFENIGIYEIELSDNEFWEILKNAGERAEFWQDNLTEDIIIHEITEYMQENHPEE